MKTFLLVSLLCTFTVLAYATESTTSARSIAIVNDELLRAVENGNEAQVRQLLNEGANVDATKTYGDRQKTPLMIACQLGFDNIVSLLLENSANITVKDQVQWGDAAIHYAVIFGRPNTLSLLLSKNGQSVDMKGQANKTPLHYAAEHGKAPMVALLLVFKANIEARDVPDWTPLHYAALRHKQIVSMLLADGANVFAKNSAGNTPRDLTRLRRHCEDDCDANIEMLERKEREVSG